MPKKRAAIYALILAWAPSVCVAQQYTIKDN
jgi:hypothetical protein